MVRNIGETVNHLLRRPQTLYPSNPPNLNKTRIDPEGIGYIQRPSQRSKRDTNPMPYISISKRNYKAYTNIGITTRTIQRFATARDTISGSSIIRLDGIPHRLKDKIELL